MENIGGGMIIIPPTMFSYRISVTHIFIDRKGLAIFIYSGKIFSYSNKL